MLLSKIGGGAGIRTPDTANMSRMLYHLSYTAIVNSQKINSQYFKAKGNKYSNNSKIAIITKSTGLIKEAEPACPDIYQHCY